MKLILASQSPRRKERLVEMGYDFISKPANIDENLEVYFEKNKLAELKVQAPEKLVMFLAKEKAKQITLSKDEWVISCDTVVWQDGEIYEKPKDFEDAKRMLKSYVKKEHQVISGYCLKSESECILGFEKTDVFCNNLSDAEIEEYINTFKPFDKAGGYGIQDGVIVDAIVGDYYNVFGFPEKIFEEIKKIERK